MNRPIDIRIEKLSLAFDSPGSDKFPLEHDESTGDLLLHMALSEQKTTLTFEGEAQEFLSYSIKAVELRFSEEFIQRLVNALPQRPHN